MTDTLLIRLAADPGAEVDYALIGGDGRLLSPPQPAPLAQLAAQASGRRTLVLVPGDAVLLTRARVPTQSSARLRRAVPYALEEQLAEDVERLHFAIGPRDAEGRVAVAVVSRERMDDWRDRLAAAGIEPDALYPETLLLEPPADGWSLLVENARCLLRGHDAQGLACDLDMLAAMATLLTGEAGSRLAVRLYRPARGAPAELPAVIEVRETRDCNTTLECLAAGLGQADLIDLQQGDYDRRERLGQLWRPWRAVALLALALAVTGLAELGLRYQRLQAEQAELRAEQEQIYRDTFPRARRVVKPVVQMRQQLEALRRSQGQAADSGFLTLLATTGEVLKASPGVRLEGAGFRDGRLDLKLSAPDLQRLDRLKQQLAARGLRVEIASATAGDGRVQGQLRIQGGRA
ncbi:type II secretion system protein GspL [Thiohalobacter sp. IOR34]|uniref:type II secretion system protein GspL n=1 Tax=Thiohalobacter sp. IOR34 TaxID=3057176 RepID=UPI0025AFB1E9|nr:type II secretion system protein GspL [Thiohalobacter sp. IOR34]WJW75223.1 type II secretion system protein GspL [Thiohalobacter sp. IOR34]